MRVAVRWGRLEHQRASALITSANDALVGNLQPEYWRFAGRDSVDGAVRAAGGPDLEAACFDLPVCGDDIRRDIFRWTAAVKHGPSAPVRCPTGTAVTTRPHQGAFGRLETDLVVHAVAPDVELAPEMYCGRCAYVTGANDRDRLPEELLRDAYASAFAAVAGAGMVDVSCPALGAGVKGWDSAVTAAFGIEAAANMAAEWTTLNDVTFVVGECDAAFGAWARVASTLLGPPREAPSDGLLVWCLEPGAIAGDEAGDMLPLRAVDELQLPRVRWATEAFVGPGYG